MYECLNLTFVPQSANMQNSVAISHAVLLGGDMRKYLFLFLIFFNFVLLDLNRRAHLIGDRMLDSPKEVSYSKQKLHA